MIFKVDALQAQFISFIKNHVLNHLRAIYIMYYNAIYSNG